MRVTQLLGTAAVVVGMTGVAGAQTPTHAQKPAEPAAKQAARETGGKTKDAWITMKTKIALMTADKVDAMDLNVDTMGGVVTLHGKVETAAEKSEAERVASRVDGVRSVTNLLQVVPDSRRDAVKASDDDVKREASKALDAERALKDSSIKVSSVNDGVVLLTGEARTYEAHLKALEIVRGVSGVKRVASEVKVDDDTTTSSSAHKLSRHGTQKHPSRQ